MERRLKLVSKGETTTTWIKWHFILSLNLSGMSFQSFFFLFSSCSLLSSVSALCRYLQV